MTQRKRSTSGFTLVEILIVVVILGILAAIVVPQFTSASESAQVSSLTATLQTVRSQLELYKVQHNGDYPTLDQLWDNMTGQTDVDGASGSDFGPYLQKPPTNPFTNSSTVAENAGADVGWVYDEDEGDIQAVVTNKTELEATELGLDTTNDVVIFSAD